ncbi:predicted protein [Histoplasma capsulatum G186AR]|uniref:Uncharacterized protein n=1 Tax=Ajellomyces capsulatus (strain G186AR / H82 / ATCC MYA-2454 / RMSCC 2432) TaxID=447093 RepID=C0NJ72_AJECG|nr:uncharacterized protein HCBG_03202 [Histoplasma capsulatum G186AR]EEH07913.1 predicted protein [Histoplasma capsulatum G186AR]
MDQPNRYFFRPPKPTPSNRIPARPLLRLSPSRAPIDWRDPFPTGSPSLSTARPQLLHKPLKQPQQPPRLSGSPLPPNNIHVIRGPYHGSPEHEPKHQHDPERDDAARIIEDSERDEEDEDEDEKGGEVRWGAQEGLERGEEVGLKILSGDGVEVCGEDGIVGEHL